MLVYAENVRNEDGEPGVGKRLGEGELRTYGCENFTGVDGVNVDKVVGHDAKQFCGRLRLLLGCVEQLQAGGGDGSGKNAQMNESAAMFVVRDLEGIGDERGVASYGDGFVLVGGGQCGVQGRAILRAWQELDDGVH